MIFEGIKPKQKAKIHIVNPEYMWAYQDVWIIAVWKKDYWGKYKWSEISTGYFFNNEDVKECLPILEEVISVK